MNDNIDIERINRKLDELEVYSSNLEEDLPDTEKEYVNNRVLKRACEKDFELICQSLIDVCNLIITQKGLGYPEDNRDFIEKLVKEDILSEDLGEKLKDMISFRNLIVHRYGKIDDRKAYIRLEEGKKDIYSFINSINSYLEDL